MKLAFSTSAIGQFISLTSLLTAVACSGSDPSSGKTQNPINGAHAQCEDEAGESEDGPNDKIVCAADTDCDSDEVCMDGKCTGMDGETEDGACDADDGDDEADDDEDEGADKITCAIDTDCDSDEYCSDGLCTGIPEACSSNADCDSGETCTAGFCEDA